MLTSVFIANAHAIEKDSLFNQIKFKAALMERDAAISYFKEIFLVAEKQGNQSDISIAILFELGNLYRLNADFAKSLQMDLFALKKAENINDQYLIAKAHENAGIDFYRNENLPSASDHFLKGLQIYSILQDSAGIARSYCKIAMITEDSKRFDEALIYYKKALQLFLIADNCQGLSDVYNGLASYYYKQYKPDSTEYYALKAMETYEKCGSQETVSFMYMNLASLKNYTKDHQKALFYLDKGLEIAKKMHLMSQLRQGYKNMSETYAYMSDFKNAYKYALIFQNYKDSIFNSEKEEIARELETRYETQKKEILLSEKQKEIDLKNLKIRRSKNEQIFLITVISLSIIILLIIIYRYFEKQKTAKILNEKNKELEEINAAKNKLFSIISHDLSSPISSFSRLTQSIETSFEKIDRDQLKEYVTEMNQSSKSIHSLLTNLLHWSIAQTGQMNPVFETQHLSELFQSAASSIFESAKQKNIKLVISIPQEITFDADKKMIETVFRNLVSNAVKFSPENATVSIFAYSHNSEIQIDFIDNGPGIPANEINSLLTSTMVGNQVGKNHKQKGTGLGLILCKEFVEKHKGKILYNENQPTGLIVTLYLPIVQPHG
jgi:signal transduction histidine kinase